MMPSDVRNLLDTTAADNYVKDASLEISLNALTKYIMVLNYFYRKKKLVSEIT